MKTELVRAESAAVELVAPVDELVATFVQSLGTSGSAQTARTYRGACGRFVVWLVDREGPMAGPEALTLASVAAYEEALAEVGLALGTIRKDRSAINRMLGFLADHDLVDRQQARLARSRRLPPPARGERERPKAVSDVQYRRLLTEVEATVARDVLLGWRDVAMVRLLGDAGLRIEELLALDRGDFIPKRKGAKLRAIRVRHGKGNRRRTVELTPAATTAVRRWDERRRELGPPAGQQSLAPGEWPLFVTIGRRRRDGSYTRLGERPTRKVVDLLLKQLGGRAEIAEDLRHAHVLRHTFATRYYRRSGRLAELQRLLGQEDPKTTMVYVHDDPAERERLMLRRAPGD